jgi:AcrR family transcriptional regulator
VSIRREAILEAARQVFLSQGYRGGTKRIARLAGVSEGSIFRHFGTKPALFVAAMEDDAGLATWDRNLRSQAGQGDIRRNLENLGKQVLDHLLVVLPRVVMVRSSGIMLSHPPTNASGVPHSILRMQAIAEYLRAEARLGRLAPGNAGMLAHIFLATLAHYAFQKTVFGFRPASPGAYIRTVVDMLLRASEPERTTGGKGRRR